MTSFPWFKFYGPEYLSDPKMLALSATRRSCWVTLLCYAAQADGTVKNLSEATLMVQAGVDPLKEEWNDTLGALEQFEKLEMIRNDNGVITVVNWKKRQESHLTGYERVKRYRERQKLDEYDNWNDNAMITTEESRVDKKRVDKKREDPRASVKYLRHVPAADLKEFAERFGVSEKQIASKAEDLLLYCESRRKTYSNYRSFLLNACKKDFAKPESKNGKYDGVKKSVAKGL
jgi:hypothetical protein